MGNLTASQILSIAEALNEAPRFTDDEVNAISANLGVTFPPAFQRLMVRTGGGFSRDESRFLALDEIADTTHDANDIVKHDFDFELSPRDIVFAWDEIYCFSYFSAVGTDDVPVYEFNYNSGTKPVLIAHTVPQGLALCLQYLLRIT